MRVIVAAPPGCFQLVRHVRRCRAKTRDDPRGFTPPRMI